MDTRGNNALIALPPTANLSTSNPINQRLVHCQFLVLGLRPHRNPTRKRGRTDHGPTIESTRVAGAPTSSPSLTLRTSDQVEPQVLALNKH
jgi:hypothetical protein